jgi:hypothetical protein
VSDLLEHDPQGFSDLLAQIGPQVERLSSSAELALGVRGN